MTLSSSSVSVSQYAPHTYLQQHHYEPVGPPRYIAPMTIPKTREAVPPPLPPPSHLPDLSAGHDLGWQWANKSSSASPTAPRPSVRPGSSLLGDRPAPEVAAPSPHRDRGDTITMTRWLPAQPPTPSDDGPSSTASSSYHLHGERQLGERAHVQSSQSYDKQLLSRIGDLSTLKQSSLSQGMSTSDPKPFSLPERRLAAPSDSPGSSHWASNLSVSGTSSGYQTPSSGMLGTWPAVKAPAPFAPASRPGLSGVTARNGSINFEDSISRRGSYDRSMSGHDDAMDEDPPAHSHHHAQHRLPPAASLRPHDRTSPSHGDSPRLASAVGVKRRASSPPRELIPREDRLSLSSISGLSEGLPRRSIQYLPGHASPVSRAHPNHSSVSSASSYGPSISSSLGPSSLVSNATSYASERLSPTSMPSTHRAVHEERRPAVPSTFTDTAPSRSSPQAGGLNHVQGVFICECCPKKPKKFETKEELRLHESEKQYTCAYCANRFKNKNEAERHQNSLHLRRHSWSCAALATVEAAFHASVSGEVDLCGYCGQQFSNPPQWDVRAEHLNHVHKFGECNQSKKFFRADHFRQHLKHSHAGTSGKWTNMLENACMKEEPPPERRTTATGMSGLR